MMTKEEMLQALRNKLAASERLGDGYGDRVKMLRKRIEEVERVGENQGS